MEVEKKGRGARELEEDTVRGKKKRNEGKRKRRMMFRGRKVGSKEEKN